MIHTSCSVLTPSSPPLPPSICSIHRFCTSSVLTCFRPHRRLEGRSSSSILLWSVSKTLVSICSTVFRKSCSPSRPPDGGRESGPSEFFIRSNLSFLEICRVCSPGWFIVLLQPRYKSSPPSRSDGNTNIIHPQACTAVPGLQTSNSIHHGALTEIQQPLISC